MTASTISKDLDRLAEEVLEVLASTVPARSYARAAPLLFTKYSLRVTPDNLRAWYVRRVAVEVAAVTPADVRNETDEYAEAIAVWYEAKLGWATIARLLAASFGYLVKEQSLRSWWHRRKKAGLKSGAGVAAVTRGVELARSGFEPSTVVSPSGSPASIVALAPVVRPAAPSPVAALTASPGAAPSAAPAPRRVYSGEPENDVQRRIRERRETAALAEGRQDDLLLRLVPGAEVSA